MKEKRHVLNHRRGKKNSQSVSTTQRQERWNVLRIDHNTHMIANSPRRILACLILFQLLNKAVARAATKGLWYLGVECFGIDNINVRILKVILKKPLFVLLILAAAFVYGLLLFWEMAVLIICMKYTYEQKKIYIRSLFHMIWRQTRRILQPNNWPFLLWAEIVITLFRMYHANARLFGWMIPEYVTGASKGAMYRFLLGFLCIVTLILAMVRLLFALYFFIFEQKDFQVSFRLTQRLIRHHALFTLLCNMVWQIVNKLVLNLLPRGIVWVLFRLQSLLLTRYGEFDTAAEFAYRKIAIPIIDYLGTALFVISLLALVFDLFYLYKKETGKSARSFCKELLPQTSTWRIIRRIPAAVYALLLAFSLTVPPILTFAMDTSPALESALEDSVKVAAHRGYMEYFPENTLPAFYAVVLSQTADYIELDVHPSADGVPVVIHDGNTLRTTGVMAAVNMMTLEELQMLDAGAIFDEEFSGTLIPTLEEVLEIYGNSIGFIIEIKNPDHVEGFEETVVDLIRQYGSADTCLIQSPNYSSLIKVKEYDPEIICGWIMHFAFGAYYDLPYVDFFSVERSFVNTSMVREIHDHGKQIFVWTVNDSRQIPYLLGADVDCIISNKPGMISRIIERNGDNLDTYMKSYLMEAFYLDYLSGEEEDAFPLL